MKWIAQSISALFCPAAVRLEYGPRREDRSGGLAATTNGRQGEGDAQAGPTCRGGGKGDGGGRVG